MTWKLYDSASNVNFKHFAFSFQLILDKFDTIKKPMKKNHHNPYSFSFHF